MSKIFAFFYRTYYLVYRVCFADRIIHSPKNVLLPDHDVITCEFVADTPYLGVQHHNFLLAEDNSIPFWILKIFFFNRKWAFRKKGQREWKKLPCLTPWSVADHQVRYGLNFTFVQLHLEEILMEEIEFVCWDM